MTPDNAQRIVAQLLDDHNVARNGLRAFTYGADNAPVVAVDGDPFNRAAAQAVMAGAWDRGIRVRFNWKGF